MIAVVGSRAGFEAIYCSIEANLAGSRVIDHASAIVQAMWCIFHLGLLDFLSSVRG